MQVKSIWVVSQPTARNKVDLAESIDAAVNNVLSSVKGELSDVIINSALEPGGFGSALVTVVYEEKKSK